VETISAFVWRQKTQKDQCLDGRSQEFIDMYWRPEARLNIV
jgi:hypothetical protein